MAKIEKGSKGGFSNPNNGTTSRNSTGSSILGQNSNVKTSSSVKSSTSTKTNTKSSGGGSNNSSSSSRVDSSYTSSSRVNVGSTNSKSSSSSYSQSSRTNSTASQSYSSYASGSTKQNKYYNSQSNNSSSRGSNSNTTQNRGGNQKFAGNQDTKTNRKAANNTYKSSSVKKERKSSSYQNSYKQSQSSSQQSTYSGNSSGFNANDFKSKFTKNDNGANYDNFKSATSKATQGAKKSTYSKIKNAGSRVKNTYQKAKTVTSKTVEYSRKVKNIALRKKLKDNKPLTKREIKSLEKEKQGQILDEIKGKHKDKNVNRIKDNLNRNRDRLKGTNLKTLKEKDVESKFENTRSSKNIRGRLLDRKVKKVNKKTKKTAAKAKYMKSDLYKKRSKIARSPVFAGKKITKGASKIVGGTNQTGLQAAEAVTKRAEKLAVKTHKNLKTRGKRVSKKLEKKKKKLEKKYNKLTKKQQKRKKKQIYKDLKKENKAELKKLNFFKRQQYKGKLKSNVYGTRMDRLKQMLRDAWEKTKRAAMWVAQHAFQIIIGVASSLTGLFIIIFSAVLIFLMLFGGHDVAYSSYPGKDQTMNAIHETFTYDEQNLKQGGIMEIAKKTKPGYKRYEIHGLSNIKHDKHSLLAYLSVKWINNEAGEDLIDIESPSDVKHYMDLLIQKKYIKKLKFEEKIIRKRVEEYRVEWDEIRKVDVVKKTVKYVEEKVMVVTIPKINIDDIAKEEFNDEELEHYYNLKDRKGDMQTNVDDPVNNIENDEAYIEGSGGDSTVIDPNSYEYKQGSGKFPPPDPNIVSPTNFGVGGQCTYYVYNRVYQLGGITFSSSLGHGGQFYVKAQALGYSVSKTAKPGTIVSFPPYLQGYGGFYPLSAFGHVAFVEGVNSDGSVVISEMNFTYNGQGGEWVISFRTLPKEYASWLYYIDVGL